MSWQWYGSINELILFSWVGNDKGSINELILFSWVGNDNGSINELILFSWVGNDNGPSVWWSLLCRNRYWSRTQISKGKKHSNIHSLILKLKNKRLYNEQTKFEYTLFLIILFSCPPLLINYFPLPILGKKNVFRIMLVINLGPEITWLLV